MEKAKLKFDVAHLHGVEVGTRKRPLPKSYQKFLEAWRAAGCPKGFRWNGQKRVFNSTDEMREAMNEKKYLSIEEREQLAKLRWRRKMMQLENH
jgi:hypothetical protein